MTEQPHGRYFAEELVLEEGADARGRIQHSFDAGERRKWRLVEVSDVPPERRVVLF